MPRIRPALVALTVSLLIALACVTINVYFPEAAVKDLSEQIEDAVAREAEEAEGAEAAPKDGAEEGSATDVSWLRSTVEIAVGAALHLVAPAPAYAQANEVAAPEISNPAIRKIIETRATRVRQLNRFKTAGAIGENNRALLEVRRLDALPLQERAAVQKLVRAENADRERMFKEIAAATGTDLSQLPKIRSTYASTLRQKARRGDLIQLPDGSWQQKR